MAVQDQTRRGQKPNDKYLGACGANPNMGGENSNTPKIDNYDAEEGFIDNSSHAIYRGKKGK